MKFTPIFTAMLVAGFVPFGASICLDGEIALGLKRGLDSAPWSGVSSTL